MRKYLYHPGPYLAAFFVTLCYFGLPYLADWITAKEVYEHGKKQKTKKKTHMPCPAWTEEEAELRAEQINFLLDFYAAIGMMDIVATLGELNAGLGVGVISIATFFFVLDAGRRMPGTQG